MEGFGSSGLSGPGALAKKRRSFTRRPRSNSWLASSASYMPDPSSNSTRRFSPDDNGCSENSFGRKEIFLNSPPPRSFPNTVAHSKKAEDGKVFQESDGYSGGGNSRGGHFSDPKHGNEGALFAPIKWKRTSKVYEGLEKKSGSVESNVGKSGDDYGTNHLGEAPSGTSENKLRKVKLKVGGVTRTIHAKSDIHSTNVRSQDILDGHSPIGNGNHLQGDPWKDSSSLNFPHGTKEDFSNKVIQTSLSGKQSENFSEPTRKSKRVPKKRVFDDDEVDDKNHYVEKHKISKVAADHVAELEDNGDNGFKIMSISKHSKIRNAPYEEDEEYVSSRSNKKNRKKSRQGREFDDMDYVEEEEPIEDDAAPDSKRKKQKTNSDSPSDVRNEPLTTRQRALQSGKTGTGESLIEFPTGLPPAPSRKQKEKLSQDEVLAKKAEAAQRRKMQVEKQARESEAAAIRKILGQDSDKKKEEKKQRELEEKAKAVELQALQPSTIRWVMGPTGTVVTFADDVGLPSIFSSKPINYPPPREKCAGPSCTNAYKYRDSKTKLPLCSLQCYRAIQGSA
ncbi:hypothetical protein Cni_G25217 [Canna indica]|uniref:INO80 complex subunit B-like conserved region domain-containing protein n=1 Tax=Canna indica TaxID=4628 RepID=A0AAQ3KXJ7_9LILI|nr:hypothetical protein Cni_G25217 [Canna indica]